MKKKYSTQEIIDELVKQKPETKFVFDKAGNCYVKDIKGKLVCIGRLNKSGMEKLSQATIKK